MRGASIDPQGYDAGKKIKRKKRHVLVDTQGLLMIDIIYAADIQDRDGGVLLMRCSASILSCPSPTLMPGTWACSSSKDASFVAIRIKTRERKSVQRSTFSDNP